jgi:glutamyl-tRNA reductase
MRAGVLPSESPSDAPGPGADGEVLGAPALPEALVLAGFECSLSTATLDELEAVAAVVGGAWLRQAFSKIPGTEEAVVLATCCRRELFVLSRSSEEAGRWGDVLPGPPGSWRRRDGRAAVHHLFRVATGRESLVVGEKEVRGQVRAAAGGVASRHRRRALRDLLAEAAETADRLVPHVPASRSIAAVAATRLLELTGRPFPRVLVVGSGEVGRQIVELLSASARVTVAYRHRAPEPEFLRSAGARAVRIDAVRPEIAVSDVVVAATKSGSPWLRADDLPPRRPMIVLDLGVPRNVDRSVRELPNVRLVDLAELRPRPGAAADLPVERQIEEAADRAHDLLAAESLEPWIAAARRNAERAREAELEVARPFLGALTPEQEVAVERLTRRLVDRLLRAPTERLRRLPPGEDGDRLRRFALELLRAEPPPP